MILSSITGSIAESILLPIDGETGDGVPNNVLADSESNYLQDAESNYLVYEE